MLNHLRPYLTCTCILMFVGVSVHAAQCRIGDPCSVFDSTLDDPRYPVMREWAKAGVEGGIPLRESTNIAVTLNPGADIQAAIDSVALAGGGVVLLNNGTYPVGGLDRAGLIMRSNVILRGQSRSGVTVESHIRHTVHPDTQPPGVSFAPGTIDFKAAVKAGVEDLTIVHADIRAMGDSCYNEFNNCPCGVCDWLTDHLDFGGARNVWVDNCNVIYAGKCMIRGSASHVTFRDNLFDVSANKGGGNGYIILGGSYILFYNNRVSRIRHITVDGFRNTVLIGNTIEVDMNWHGKSGLCAGDILTEKNIHFTPQSHEWDIITYRGCYASQYAYFFRNVMYNGKENYRLTFSHPDTVYKFCDSQTGCAALSSAYTQATGQTGFSPEMIVYGTPLPVPAHGTFYPVKGNAVSAPAPMPTLTEVKVNGAVRDEGSILLDSNDTVALTAWVPQFLTQPEGYVWEFGDGTVRTGGAGAVYQYTGTGFFSPTVKSRLGEWYSLPSLKSVTFYRGTGDSGRPADSVVPPPRLTAVKLGTTCPTPYTIYAQGIQSVDGSSYTLVGQGHDINYGWDRGAFAYVPVSADTFTFTARIRQIPATMSNGKCGIMVREGLVGNERAIDLRYDSYDGFRCLTWFFRFIPGTSVSEFCADGSRTSCNYMGAARDLTMTDSVWLRIERLKPRFRISASADGQTWVRLAQEGSYARLAGESSWANLTKEQPLFLGRDTVYVGLSLAGGSQGSRRVTIVADQISLRYGQGGTPVSLPDLKRAGTAQPQLALAQRRLVLSFPPDWNGPIPRTCVLIDTRGRSVVLPLEPRGRLTVSADIPGTGSPGVYLVQFSPGNRRFKLMVCR